MYHLPTESSRPASSDSSYRVEEIFATSKPKSTGGGSIQFDVQSAANSWWVPSNSYFLVKFNITKTAETSSSLSTAATYTLTDSSTTPVYTGASAGVYFNNYPAASVIQSITHSINGTMIESLTEVPELSQIDIRTHYSREHYESLAGTMRLKKDGAGIFDKSSLKPWDGTSTEFECMWVPCTALFKHKGALPGLRQRFSINLHTDLAKRVLHTESSTYDIADYNVTIADIVFYAAILNPSGVPPVPSSVVLSLPCMSMSKQNITGSGSLSFSVPPSTDKIFVTKGPVVGDLHDGDEDNAAGFFSDDLTSCEIEFAGQRRPFASMPNLPNSRSYLEYVTSAGFLFRGMGMPYGQTTHNFEPIHGFVFSKHPNDSSSQVQLRMTSGDTSDRPVGVCAISHKILKISYGSDQLAQYANVIEDLS